MNWKEFFKPIRIKIILMLLILLLFILIFGIPIQKFVLCEPCQPSGPCTPCPKIIDFISIKQLTNSLEFIGKGIWFIWYLYLLEIVLSYLVNRLL